MNVQEIIVCLIVFVSFLLAARRIVHYFNKLRKEKNVCEGCSIRCMCSGKSVKESCPERKNT